MAIRGLEHGRPVDRTVEVASIDKAWDAATHWDEVLDFARGDDLRIVVSNTTEAGYALNEYSGGTSASRAKE